MKRFFIVHRWGGTPTGDWYPWLKKELENKGFYVMALEMPNSDNPQIKEWVDYLAQEIGSPDGETYLVGHSIGCQTIIRYAERLKDNEKIGGSVFVAGWFTLTGLESDEEKKIADPWINQPIDYARSRARLGKTCAIFSDNDPFVPISNIALFERNLGCETLLESGKGHFTEVDEVTESPSILELVLKISSA